MSDPSLDPAQREILVVELMNARRLMGEARRNGDRILGATAKAVVDAAKRSLGERSPVWWDDGSPAWNRHLARNTPYADWFAGLQIPPGTAT